ncbi:hypothetical protein Hanom_Chr05g00386001 [Helianthus anomalus]
MNEIQSKSKSKSNETVRSNKNLIIIQPTNLFLALALSTIRIAVGVYEEIPSLTDQVNRRLGF